MSDSVSKVGENIFEGTEFINSLKPDEYGCIYLGNLLLKANDTKEYVKIKDSTKAIAAKAFINNIRIKNFDPEMLNGRKNEEKKYIKGE